MTYLVSTLVCFLIGFGLVHRKNRKVHVPLMVSAFVIDISLVLYIEFTRKAVETALTPQHPLVVFHIVISVVVVLLYILQIGLGMNLLRFNRFRPMHRLVGFAFIVFRFGNFVTSFLIEGLVQRH